MNADAIPIHSDPEILGGKPVFVGTRVPVKTLWDYLEGGDSLDVFLDDFPSVSREQAIADIKFRFEAGTRYPSAVGMLKQFSESYRLALR